MENQIKESFERDRRIAIQTYQGITLYTTGAVTLKQYLATALIIDFNERYRKAF